jgi:hypothetical protein
MKEIQELILKEKQKDNPNKEYIQFLQQLSDKKELSENLVNEVKQRNFLEKQHKQNTIEFDDYFRYSGRVEETKEGSYKEYEKWIRKNPMVDKMREHMEGN